MVCPLWAGVAAAALTVLIGITVGSLSGFYGGLADECLMRITEFFQVMPSLILAESAKKYGASAPIRGIDARTYFGGASFTPVRLRYVLIGHWK